MEMAMGLFDSLEALAVSFAFDVVAGLRDVSLAELVELGSTPRAEVDVAPRTRRGRAANSDGSNQRREDRAEGDLRSKVLVILGRSPAGLRTETLRSLVSAPKSAYQSTMSKLVKAGQVIKTGAKRATTYRRA